MSAKYPYLDIAISVLNEGLQPVNYSFNSAPTIALPSLSDLARHFVNLSDGYVMWQIGGRRAYTYFRLDEAGSSTVLAITVRLEPDILMAGSPIVKLLGAIRHTLEDGAKLTHESLMRALSDAGFPEEPLRSDAEVDLPAAAAGLCCRTYISNTELATIMAFPRQEEYARYQGVIVVPATVSMQPESSIPLITRPIDKALMVVCPEGVSASSNRVELSDHLSVTYLMAGFEPQSVEFEVGTTNRFVRINGPALVVNSARHAGIIFKRAVPYTVASANGATIDTYTILINGRTATRGDGTFEITNNDFTDGKVTISVSSTNFGSYSNEFTPEELSEALPLEFVLEPEARQICLRLDFGVGRIVENTITLEKSAPEYNQLRAGTFHGFRAHRLVGSKPETYNIDLRPQAAQPAQQTLDFDNRQEPAATAQAGKETERTVSLNVAPASAKPQQKADEPVAPAEKPAAATAAPAAAQPAHQRTSPQRHHGPVAPIIEKAPSAVWEVKTHKRVAPKFENVTDSTDNDNHREEPAAPRRKSISERLQQNKTKTEEPANEKNERETKFDIRLIIVGVAVVAAGLVIWWLMLLFSGNDNTATDPAAEQQPATESIEEVNYTDAAGVSGNAAPGQQPAAAQPAAKPAPVAAADDNEKADIAYLNDNTTWKLADLKSEKYRALITAMQQGDIQAVASNPYFSIPGTATNKKAISVVNYLWKAKGSNQEKRNTDKLRELTKADKANLGELIDDLSRFQPAEGNNAPRPGAN